VNLSGVFLCAREAAAHMIERGNGGVIVNISSISRQGNAGQSNYSAAKAGVESMSRRMGKGTRALWHPLRIGCAGIHAHRNPRGDASRGARKTHWRPCR
jgi:3-oxoacyl-[acyl-carrier protein] reductase